MMYVMYMGRWSWVMWVMGQLCDGPHGSWVTKDDPFPSLHWFSDKLVNVSYPTEE